MSEPINLRVPKSMHPDDVVWAFRYGVAWARYSVLGDASAICRHGLAYTNHYRNVFRLGDRVRREAIRRLRERENHADRGSGVTAATTPDTSGSCTSYTSGDRGCASPSDARTRTSPRHGTTRPVRAIPRDAS